MKTNDSKGKLFRQLSDEELEKVTGGGPKNISAFFGGAIGGALFISMLKCPDSEKDENGNCPQNQ